MSWIFFFMTFRRSASGGVRNRDDVYYNQVLKFNISVWIPKYLGLWRFDVVDIVSLKKVIELYCCLENLIKIYLPVGALLTLNES